MDGQQQARIARNEAAFRELNERQVGAVRDFRGAQDAELDVVCECGDASCHETLHMTGAQYAQVRSDPRWFAVRAGHIVPEVETREADHGAWWVVRKSTPIGGRIVEETA